MPVLTDVNEPIPVPVASALDNVTNKSRLHPSSLPTISVTKPPAPLPVELPTPHDIEALPSPLHSNHPSFNDLESGRSRGMREISREQDAGLVSSSRRQPQSQLPTRHANANASSSSLATSVPLPLSPLANPSTELAQRLSPSPDIPDLLVDSAPALETTPINPSSPLTPPLKDIPAMEPEHLVDPSDIVNSEDALEPVVEGEVDPDVTIRLVGGGGTAGIVDGVPPPSDEEIFATSSEPDLTDVASDPSTKMEKKHKKTKSGLAGLKKLGHLGGLRKKDSSSSVKDTASASSLN